MAGPHCQKSLGLCNQPHYHLPRRGQGAHGAGAAARLHRRRRVEAAPEAFRRRGPGILDGVHVRSPTRHPGPRNNGRPEALGTRRKPVVGRTLASRPQHPGPDLQHPFRRRLHRRFRHGRRRPLRLPCPHRTGARAPLPRNQLTPSFQPSSRNPSRGVELFPPRRGNPSWLPSPGWWGRSC